MEYFDMNKSLKHWFKMININVPFRITKKLI